MNLAAGLPASARSSAATICSMPPPSEEWHPKPGVPFMTHSRFFLLHAPAECAIAQTKGVNSKHAPISFKKKLYPENFKWKSIRSGTSRQLKFACAASISVNFTAQVARFQYVLPQSLTPGFHVGMAVMQPFYSLNVYRQSEGASTIHNQDFGPADTILTPLMVGNSFKAPVVGAVNQALKWRHEFMAENRPQGDRFWVQASFKL